MTKIPKLNSEELRTLKSVVSPARAAAWARTPAPPVKARDSRRVLLRDGGETTMGDVQDIARGITAITLGEIATKADLARLQPMIRALVKAEVSARLATRGIREYR